MNERRVPIAVLSASGLLLGLLALLVWHRVGRSDHVLYVPVVFTYSKPLYREAPELNTPEHQAALVPILQQYGYDAVVTERGVMISRHLARDQDLLANFTSRAQEASRSP